MTQATVGIVGAGEIGRSTAAAILATGKWRVAIFDPSATALSKATALDPSTVDSYQRRLRAEDAAAVARCEVIVNTAGPFFSGSTEIAELALDADCPYVDICDDAEGVVALNRLSADAEKNGIALITGAGLSPGLSSVLARRLLDLYPEADGIDVAWVVREDEPGGLAALRHLLHMAVAPCARLDHGVLVYDTGFQPTTASDVRFDEPIGQVEVYLAPHPEPVTFPWTHPTLKDITCRGGLLPEWANATFSSLARVGFGIDGTLGVSDGGTVDPAEVLWRVLWRRHEQRPSRRSTGFAAIRVTASRDGEPIGTSQAVDPAAMARATGIGAATVVLAALDEAVPGGVWGPEKLDAERALHHFDALRERTGTFDAGVVTRRAATEPIVSTDQASQG